MNNGYIKLYRSMIGWEWYQDANTCRVFLHLLLTANHTEAEWKGTKILSGQLVTSRQSLAHTLKLSEKQIRIAIDHLKRSGEVAVSATNKYSLVTIANWASYQIVDSERASKTAIDRVPQRSTNNNDKKERNIYSADFEQFWSTYPRPKDKQAACKCWLARIKDGFTVDDLIRAASVYATECTGKDPQYIKHPKTFLAPNGSFTEYQNQPAPSETTIDPDNVSPEFTAPWSCITEYHQNSGGQSDE